MSDLSAHFPAAPSLSAYWAPIYLEPMHGSGERLTAAVVCVADSGAVGVDLTVRNRILKCMYGDQGERLMGMARLIRDSLQEHFAIGGGFDNWLPPTPSCFLGPVRVALGDSVEHILTKAAALTASTSGAELDQPESPEIDSAAPDVDLWLDQIKAAVSARNPNMEPRFNQEVILSAGAMPTRIGFLGDRIAANFDALVPGANFSGKRSRSKARMLDLQILRDADLLARKSYDLMLWVPARGMPAFSERGIENAHAALLELRDFGEKHDLKVHGLHHAEEAADRIFSIELGPP